MPRFRLAHFSDIHYTLNPATQMPESLIGKRVAGWASYFVGGRGARFDNSGARIATLLEDVDSLGVDHALCTGDLTSTSLKTEFEGLAEVFGDRLNKPDGYTVIPGNHDRYVPQAISERLFEKSFAGLSAQQFPFSKTIGDGVRVIALDASRPTSLVDSSGLCGPKQREALARLLAEDTKSATIVAMHYGLLRWRGHPDRLRHGMRDAREVLEILNSSPARIALVVHGHMHAAFTVSTGKYPIVCAGSAIDLLVACGYCLYDIDPDTLAVRIERRQWDRAAQRFAAADATVLNEALQQRRGATLDRRLVK